MGRKDSGNEMVVITDIFLFNKDRKLLSSRKYYTDQDQEDWNIPELTAIGPLTPCGDVFVPSTCPFRAFHVAKSLKFCC